MGRSAAANAEQREAMRGRLLDAGLELFAARGVDGVSVGAIAAAAGCSKGLLYHYFPTKQALAEAVLRRWLAEVHELAAAAAAAAEGAPPTAALAAFARAMAGRVAANPNSYRLQLRALADPGFRSLAGELVGGSDGAPHPMASAFAAVGSEAPDLDGRFFQTALLGIFAHHVLSPRPTPIGDLVEHLIHLTLER